MIIKPEKAQSVADGILPNTGQLLVNTRFAAATGGEIFFMQTIHSDDKLINTLGPFKYLLSGIVRVLKGLKEALKDKRRLLFAVSLVFIWLVLIVLQILGVKSRLVSLLSFLTFAHGGSGGGILGILGGTIGKGFYAYFVTVLILPCFSGKKPFKGIGTGIETLLGSFAVKDMNSFVHLILGGGMSLIIYNFLTGNASLQNSMVGIVAFILMLQALSRKTGFLRGFIMSVVKKISRCMSVETSCINRIMAGFTTGFVLSIPLSAIKVSSICYIAGIVFIAAAIILIIVARKEKKVKAV